MSARCQSRQQMSIEDYLAFEDRSAVKHEFAAGEVFTMAGASERHNRISMNIAGALHQFTRRTKCSTLVSDMKVKIDQVIYYPDVLVACDAEDSAPYFKTAPSLIVEVLSTSTERIDRGEKLYNYRQIATLKAYVLVSQNDVRVDVYRRAGSQWYFESYADLSDLISLECPETVISLADIYERIGFPNPEIAVDAP